MIENNVCVYNEECFTNYLEKVKDAEYEHRGRSEDVSHSGFRTDNESINESEMSTF